MPPIDMARSSVQIVEGNWDKILRHNRASRVSTAYLSHFQHEELRRRSSQDTIRELPEVRFATQSTYAGQWHTHLNAMCGTGRFVMPHGVVYQGQMKDGRFDGEGVLTYPSKNQIYGKWCMGVYLGNQYQFKDGIKYYPSKWKYCTPPDRAFYVEYNAGFQPAGRSNKTQVLPTREIPEGCYDTGDGFYNPKTRMLTSPNGKLLRVPTNEEASWIMSNCRRAWDENAGYRPDLTEKKDHLGIQSQASLVPWPSSTESVTSAQDSPTENPGILKRNDGSPMRRHKSEGITFVDQNAAIESRPSLQRVDTEVFDGQASVFSVDEGDSKEAVRDGPVVSTIEILRVNRLTDFFSQEIFQHILSDREMVTFIEKSPFLD